MAVRPRNILVALNAALLIALAVLTLAPVAGARQPAGPRPRGSYAMVAGKMTGATTSPVYVVDSVNQELVALLWNRNAYHFEVFGWRSLGADSSSGRNNR